MELQKDHKHVINRLDSFFVCNIVGEMYVNLKFIKFLLSTNQWFNKRKFERIVHSDVSSSYSLFEVSSSYSMSKKRHSSKP